MGYVEFNPVLGVRLPPKRNVRPKITFEPSRITQILEVFKEPHRTMVLLAAVTGIRASEMFGLQWSDVDFDRRLLFIRRTYYRGAIGLPKNNASERVIPLSPVLLGALYAHKQHVRCGSIDLIFPNAVGKPYEPNNLVKRVLHPALSSLGLPKTGWRAFRRTVATALSEMREPVRTAQQVLGHSSAQATLAYYVQSVEESQRSAITRLEEIMFPNVPKFEKGSSLSR
jgi:integrase